MVSITGYYTTKFGELWEKSLSGLIDEVITNIMRESKLEKKRIDAIFFGNMLAGILENNLHTPSKIAEIMGVNIPVFRVEAACASGGVAFHLAKNYLDANKGKTVLVIGAEKMTDYSPEEIVSALSSAASGEEQEAGLTFAGLYAMIANYYLDKYQYQEENLAHVSVKNHYHGSLNDKAQFRKVISLESVMSSPYVAHPLKVMDSSPISDGASALILTSNESVRRLSKNKVNIKASEVATDTISLKERERLDEIQATKIAAVKAFKSANVNVNEIDVAEVHDCFSIAEILAMEDIGFWKKGEGGEKITSQETMYGKGGKLVVNTSGGLKASGHPVGATGIKQIGEIFLQLTNQAKNRQVKGAELGLAHNVGGSGGTAVVTILGI